MTTHARRQALRNLAQQFYRQHLAGDPVAQRYLLERGIGAELARRLQLGAAPGGWTTVCDLLRGRGFTSDELLDAGVGFRTSKGRVVDVFRSRVLFPQHDEHGHLVGWAGRATPDGPPQSPRWLNSSAGDYRKSELLHGLHEGRVRLAAGAVPVLCEGVLDAHAITRATDGNYVGLAPGGTALTAQHLEALQRQNVMTAGRLLLAFDGDDAGRAAAVAVYPLVPAAEYVTLPPGSDPADTPASVLRDALEDTCPLADLAVDATLARWASREQTAETRVSALRDVADLLVATPDGIARQVVRVATALGMTFAEVSAELADAVSRRAGSSASAAATDAAPAAWRCDGNRSATDGRIRSAAAGVGRGPG